MKCLTPQMFNICNRSQWDTGSLLPKLMPQREDIHIVYMHISGYLSDGKYGTSTFESFCTEKNHIAHFTSLPKLTKAAQSACGEH